jgi:hypothetical protein
LLHGFYRRKQRQQRGIGGGNGGDSGIRTREYSGNFAVQFSMKKTLHLTGLAFLGTLAAAMLLTGCAAEKATQEHGKAPGPVYETAEEIKAMPPCEAKIVRRSPCSVCLRTAGGKGFYLGSPGSKADVGRFLAALKDGQTYDFPDVFLKYQGNQKGTEP